MSSENRGGNSSDPAPDPFIGELSVQIIPDKDRIVIQLPQGLPNNYWNVFEEFSSIFVFSLQKFI